MTVKLEDTVYFHFGTSSPSTGAATNADSTPTVSVEEDGTLMGYSPSVSNVATGLYRATVAATTANGFEATKRYSLYAEAAVGGISGRDGIAEFECVASSLDDLAVPGDAMALTSGERSSVADAIHDEVFEGSVTLRQALRLLYSALGAKSSGGGTTSITFRDLADSKNRIAATVDSNGNRTAITLDLT
jgi:hypothetical protein